MSEAPFGRFGRLAAALAAAAACAGCLKREERITIREDGSVAVVHRITGGGRDIDGGAASMPRRAVFEIARTTEPRDDGKRKKHVLEARAVFPSVAAMPEHHAPPATRAAASALTFENHLRVRREGNDRVYVFLRRYEPRSWARFAHRRDELIPKAVERAIKDGLREKPVKRRRRAIAARLAYERAKHVAWAADALAALPGIPDAREAEARVAVRAALERHVEKRLAPRRLAERIVELTNDEVAARAKRIRRGMAKRGLAAAAGHLGLDGPARKRLRRAFRDAERAYRVTRDLGDERFAIVLRMPGTVRRHNADERRDGALVWKFRGKALRDRAPTLIAVSAVADAEAGER